MKNSTVFKQQLSDIKTNVIESLKNLMVSQNLELVSKQDLEDGDYEQNYITLRNDYGNVYDVLIIGVENGKLLTHNEDSENYESNITPLSDIESTDDLILLLDLLEDNLSINK